MASPPIRDAERGVGAGASPTAGTLDGAASADGTVSTLDAMHVGEPLDRLQRTSTREAEVLLLRFFGGLRDEDTAAMLGVDARTVRRDCCRAKEELAAWAAEGADAG
jgi:DNA-directed RNA polymerase specialized sigma24 family protein